jgi:hypothetical protein
MPKTFVIPKQTLPWLAGRKLHAMKIRDGFENKTWGEYFTFLVDKMDITLQPTMTTAIQAGTEQLFPMWMKNFAENIPYIRSEKSHSISELAVPAVVDKPEHSAIVIGRGPSVFQHKHLEVLADAKAKGNYAGLVVASDGILLECLKEGIIPDLTVSVDGSTLIKKWYDDPLVDSRLKVALPVTIDNSVYQTCIDHGCTVYWFVPQFDFYYAKESVTKVMRLMTRTPKNPDGLVMTSLGGNSGAAAWVFAAFVLKCSPVCLIGIDFGYPENTKLVDTPYYSSMIQQPVDVDVAYDEIYHPYFKTKAHIDGVFTGYKETFLNLQNTVEAWYIKAGGTINATEGGCLYGQGIKCMPFKEFLEKFKK